MAGWHHWLDGHEFEGTPGVGDGQGGLECCNSWVAKSWTWLSDWTELNWTHTHDTHHIYTPLKHTPHTHILTIHMYHTHTPYIPHTYNTHTTYAYITHYMYTIHIHTSHTHTTDIHISHTYYIHTPCNTHTKIPLPPRNQQQSGLYSLQNISVTMKSWRSDKESTCQRGGCKRLKFDLLEKEMAIRSSILAWKIPWIEEPGGLQSMGS